MGEQLQARGVLAVNQFLFFRIDHLAGQLQHGAIHRIDEFIGEGDTGKILFVVRCGGRYLIFHRPEAVEFRLRDSGAKVVVTDAAHSEMVHALKDGLPGLEHIVVCDQSGELRFDELIEKASDEFDTLATACDDPALLIYTSGTTGPPKGALVPHRALIGNLTGFEMSQNFFPQSNDVFWSPADWAWTGGLIDALLPSLVYARPIVAYHGGKFDPERGLQLCEKYNVTNAFIPPTALKMIRQIRDIPEKFELKLRAIMSAGEQVGDELIGWGKEALGVEINEMVPQRFADARISSFAAASEMGFRTKGDWARFLASARAWAAALPTAPASSSNNNGRPPSGRLAPRLVCAA